MGKVLDFFSYNKSPGSQAGGSLTNKAKVPSQKEFRNKVSGEFLKRKLGEIKFKDGTYQGLGLRSRIEQMYGKRGYAKTSEYQFTEDLRKSGVREKDRIKIKRLWRSTFAKQQEEDIISSEETQRRVREGQISSQMADEKKMGGAAIVKGIKDSADYTALGIIAPKHQISARGEFTPADDYPGKSIPKIGIGSGAGSKTADKPPGVVSGLGINQQTRSKPVKGVRPIGMR